MNDQNEETEDQSQESTTSNPSSSDDGFDYDSFLAWQLGF